MKVQDPILSIKQEIKYKDKPHVVLNITTDSVILSDHRKRKFALTKSEIEEAVDRGEISV